MIQPGESKAVLMTDDTLKIAIQYGPFQLVVEQTEEDKLIVEQAQTAAREEAEGTRPRRSRRSRG